MNAQTLPIDGPVQPRQSLLARLRGRLPKRRPLGPGMALWLLSPIIAELCSGATPFFAYIFFGWVLCLMYGGGAILIREMTLRWGKGWPTILALGVAYAISEEGIAVRTFFDPTAPQVQGLGSFGWAGGVNWVWATHLSLYHAIVSIAIPIFLVSLAYPARRNEPWVSDRWLKRAAAGYVGVVLFFLLFFHRPVEGGYMIASVAAIAAIVWLARRLPATISVWPGTGDVPTPRRVAIVGFAAVFTVFAFAWGRGLGLMPFDTILAMLGIAGVTGWWFLRSSARPGWTDRHRYAVAAGIVFFLPLISPLIELSGGRGEIVVGIVFAWLLRRTWRRLRAAQAPVPPMQLQAGADLQPATEVRPPSAC